MIPPCGLPYDSLFSQTSIYGETFLGNEKSKAKCEKCLHIRIRKEAEIYQLNSTFFVVKVTFDCRTNSLIKGRRQEAGCRLQEAKKSRMQEAGCRQQKQKTRKRAITSHQATLGQSQIFYIEKVFYGMDRPNFMAALICSIFSFPRTVILSINNSFRIVTMVSKFTTHFFGNPFS